MIFEIVLSFTNFPETQLLSVEEPVGTYPYTRQDFNCYRAISKLVVDIASNQACVHLARLVGANCSQFPMGVLYDLSFSNQVTWRSQQRDFDYFQTDQFCFPCYNSDCSFITSTTLASMRISSEIYTSLIPIGAIVIQKSNQSDCYDGSVSALRRSSTHQMLKLYPKAACSYVFSDCVMTKYVEEKYRDSLISSESTDVSLLEWNQFKIPVVDQYGSYFQILETKPVDLNDGLLYSIFRIYYSCSKIEMEHTMLINFITSYDNPNFGSGAAAIIENKYIGYQMQTVNPNILSQQISEIDVQVQFTNKLSNEIENVFDFRLTSFNFMKQYIYCDQVISMLHNASSVNLSQQCQNHLKALVGKTENLIILFSFKFNGLFATYLVRTITTGCWETVEVVLQENQLCFHAENANIQSCPLIQEQKSTVNAVIEVNGIYQTVATGTKYYSVQNTQQICIECDSVCQTSIAKKNVLMTIQSMVIDTSYSEIWMEFQEQADTTKDVNVPIIAGISCCAFICALIMYEVITGCVVRRLQNKKNAIKINDVVQDMDEIE
ncbi:Conserved_hypothetical protein [Hexamita inflata]|uniref:Uncharacterized protein n=1 Tax=Hexamita inflata TaxID=28002 RepID=A0AA86VQQ0_9EUKA|nr:Conserved hypothetical protein [Hexamita inflata]